MPIAVFNRTLTELSKGIVVVAVNPTIAEAAADFVEDRAPANAAGDGKLDAVIAAGDLCDPNAAGCKGGFYAAIDRHADR